MMELAKPKLFLLKPDFKDAKISDEKQLYYCPHCAFIEGLLSYYPYLKNDLEISYVEFQKPRNAIIALLGENNQSCPVLIIEADNADKQTKDIFKQHSIYLFSNDTKIIAKYFADKFGIGLEHP